MKRIILIVLVLEVFSTGFSQEKKAYIELVRVEDQLQSMFNRLYNEDVTGLQMGMYHTIDSLFNYALNLPGSYDYPWNKLDNIGRLKSDDGNVKVFSWMYMSSRNNYNYTCYIQLKKKKGDYKIFKLLPGTSEEIMEENYPQKITDWHGKIYYEIVTTKYKRKVFYTLIGADYNNMLTMIKTVEVFAVQRGKPVFRGDQFLDGGKVKNRLVFEYSADVASSVRYNNQLDMIVFDHLAPLHPLYQGNYQFYGPDGSYDGLRFIDGVWVKEEDVDARNRQ